MDALIELLKQSSPFLIDKSSPPRNQQSTTLTLIHTQDSCTIGNSVHVMESINTSTSAHLLPLPIVGIIVFISITITLLLLIQFVLLPSSTRSRGYLKHLLQHAVITGGSSGIGLAIAKELVRRQCSDITLIARGEMKLKVAQITLEKFAKEIGSPSIISIYPVDVTNASAMQKCAKDICESDNTANTTTKTITNQKVPTLLFNVAGTAIAKEFLKTPTSEFEKLMVLNYLGSVYTTHAFLPYMLPLTTRDNDDNAKSKTSIPKTIIFTSSAAGQVGIFGYSAYSPTKYALRGFAEVLQMEFYLNHIHVQVAYPPDTDTPGYQLEQIDKPKETQLMSEAAGLFKPEIVAKGMVNAALASRPPFFVTFGIEGWLLGNLTGGMSPVHRLVDAVIQILFMGFFRFLSLFFLMDFRRIVNKVGSTKHK